MITLSLMPLTRRLPNVWMAPITLRARRRLVLSPYEQKSSLWPRN